MFHGRIPNRKFLQLYCQKRSLGTPSQLLTKCDQQNVSNQNNQSSQSNQNSYTLSIDQKYLDLQQQNFFDLYQDDPTKVKFLENEQKLLECFILENFLSIEIHNNKE